MAVRAAWLLPRTVSDGQTREDTRLAMSGAMTPTGALTSRSGVMPGGGFDLVGTGAMTFTIGSGKAYVQGTSAQGAYPVVSTSTTAFTAVDGHATNPRIDLYVLRIYDHFIDSSGNTMAAIERVAGTAAPVPVVPSVPTGAIPLWELRVPAGASAGGGGIQSSPGWSTARTDRRYFTAASGGIVPSGGPSWDGAYVGQYRDNPTTGRPERWDGSAWIDVAWNTAWGWQGSAFQSTGGDGVDVLTLVPDLHCTITMRTDRRYSANTVLTWWTDSELTQANLSIRYVYGATINTNGSGTTELTSIAPYSPGAGIQVTVPMYAETVGVFNGSVTFGAFYDATTSPWACAISDSSGNTLAVHDIGPGS